MDLKIFFSPIPEEVYGSIKDPNSLLKSIHIFEHTLPDIKGANVAIIGVEEYRGTTEPTSVHTAANEIRKKLYRLKKGAGPYKVVDLGNLRPGINITESHNRLKEVCSMLMANEVVPVIIGSTHDFSYAQYLAYENLDKLVSVLIIDAIADMQEGDSEINNRNHLHKLLLHEPNFLFNLSLFGYQTYLIDHDTLNTLSKLYFDTYRLGHIRQDLKESEPIIREADILSFDITSIKSSDAPGNANPQPFGLTGEEACQICWYAGLNEKLSSAGFYEYSPDDDSEDKKTAAVVATMLWYFIEGVCNRKDESHFRGNDYLRYVVSMPQEPATLVFYKSKLSEKWWLEVPYPDSNFTYERNLIIPCSYTDYQKAQKGEIPERWIMTQNKLI